LKPLNLIVLLLFLGGVAWSLTRSQSSVREIQRAYYTAMSPFFKAGSEFELYAHSLSQEIEHSQALKEQLDLAEQNLGKLRTEIFHLRQLEEENTQLRSALDFKARTPFKVVASNVIGRNPSTWWQTLSIDRGESSNLSLQLPVLAAEGLVGKIDRTNTSNSSVILLTDEACQVSAKIEGTQEVGILSGQRVQTLDNPVLRLRYLSKEAQIQPGSKVLTTGRGGLFPADILLGTVISFEPGAFHAEAHIEPAVDFAALNTVFVLTGLK